MSKEEKLSQEEKITDLQYLQELSEGNKAFITEMLQMFIDTIPNSVVELHQALNGKDWKTLYMVAHKIKPSFGFVGLKSCEQLLQRIEKNASDMPDPVLLSELLNQVSSLTERCIIELKAELSALS